MNIVRLQKNMKWDRVVSVVFIFSNLVDGRIEQIPMSRVQLRWTFFSLDSYASDNLRNNLLKSWISNEFFHGFSFKDNYDY